MIENIGGDPGPLGGMNVGQYLFSKAGVQPEEMDNAITWAFGKLLTSDMTPDVLYILWNSRHSDIFEVGEDEQMLDVFLWSVGKAYMEANFNLPKEERTIIQ